MKYRPLIFLNTFVIEVITVFGKGVDSRLEDTDLRVRGEEDE